MDTDRLNRWLTLGANIGVLAGILFLALELRQNTDLMRAQSRTELAQDTIDLLTLNVSDADYLDAIDRALAGEELTRLEETQFRRTYYGWMWHWNNLAYLNRVGLYDDAEFQLQINVIRGDIERFPGLRRHWCSYRDSVASPDVVIAIEGPEGSSLCEGIEPSTVEY